MNYAMAIVGHGRYPGGGSLGTEIIDWNDRGNDCL